MPHECVDPIVAVVAMVQSIQTILSRNVFAMDKAVIYVTQIYAGTGSNIIPQEATFCTTIRSFTPQVCTLLKSRFMAIVEGHAPSFGVQAHIDYDKGYPPTVNTPENAEFAVNVAREVAGDNNVNANHGREMGSEDFSYMLERRPGAYLFMGIGPASSLHRATYNFNDEASPIGASFSALLVEKTQPLNCN
jgi:hippurate hydrolase